MGNPYQLVVFDWEGTIADTIGQVIHIIASQAQLLGFTITPEYARKFTDLGLIQAIKKMIPDAPSLKQEELIQAVQTALSARPTEIFLLPGVVHFINALQTKGVDLAIATNKGHQSLTRALQLTGLEKQFRVTRSAGQVPAKPHPQMLEEIMDEFNVDYTHTLMIGDSPSDMEMATHARVAAIGVDFYHQQESSLKAAGALAVFDDYQQLADFIKLPRMK